MTSDQTEPGEPDTAVLGVVEDDRMRAVAYIGPDASHVRIEGRLDEDTAPVVEELLDALDRWHRPGNRRNGSRDDERLVIDATAARPCDPAGWLLLADHRDRWRRTRGPCDVRSIAIAQPSAGGARPDGVPQCRSR